MIRCPKCGLDQPPAAECGRCGVVFAKVWPPPAEAVPRPARWEPPAQTVASPPVERPDAPPPRPRGASGAYAGAALVLMAVFSFVYLARAVPRQLRRELSGAAARRLAARQTAEASGGWYSGADGYDRGERE